MNDFIENLHLRVFLWSGSRLWGAVSLYCPDGEDGNVQAMHFAADEQTLLRSCREMSENNEPPDA